LAQHGHVDKSVAVIEMRNIVKKFGDFVANDGINLTVHKGEVHAILGENGAGKSTLMNQLYGMYTPTSGQIFVHGQEVVFDNPKKAIEAGIGMVHQHFMLVQPFTVTENIILGMEPVRGITLNREEARRSVAEISEKYGLAIDPDAKIEDISVGMQQRVEILKALYRGAEILILDEPTACLTPQEIEELIEIMRSLTADGKSILLITHKLKEIKAAADCCTIIRLGKYIDTVDVDERQRARSGQPDGGPQCEPERGQARKEIPASWCSTWRTCTAWITAAWRSSRAFRCRCAGARSSALRASTATARPRWSRS
jgi:ABC-type uncharacterized transport system ATPase subunit